MPSTSETDSRTNRSGDRPTTKELGRRPHTVRASIRTPIGRRCWTRGRRRCIVVLNTLNRAHLVISLREGFPMIGRHVGAGPDPYRSGPIGGRKSVGTCPLATFDVSQDDPWCNVDHLARLLWAGHGPSGDTPQTGLFCLYAANPPHPVCPPFVREGPLRLTSSATRAAHPGVSSATCRCSNC